MKRILMIALLVMLLIGRPLPASASSSFQAASVVYVDDNWSAVVPGADPDADGPAVAFGVDAFATIQEGVDAVAPGGTVNVAAGTYVEQVTIDHSLTITGAGVDQTIVQAPEFEARAKITRVFSDGTPDQFTRVFDYIIAAVDTDDVLVEELTVDGLSKGGPCTADWRGAGVLFLGSSATLHTAKVVNASQAAANFGCQDGAWQGVLAIGDSAPAVDEVEISDVTVEAFQKNGINAWADSMGGLDVEILRNTVTTVFESRTAQNGIQVSNGAGGVVGYNTVTRVFYTGPDWSASSILLQGSAPVLVERNAIMYGQVGVYQVGGEATIDMNGYVGPGPGEVTRDYYGVVVLPTADYPLVDFRVTNNTIRSFENNPDAAAMYVIAGDLEAGKDAAITGNVVQGWENGIYLDSCTADCNVNFNRIVDNTLGLYSGSAAPLDAQNNWWGCNAGPADTTGACSPVDTSDTAGAADYDPWLMLTLEADTTQLFQGDTANLLAALNTNSDDEDLSGTPMFALQNTDMVDFATTLGTLGADSVVLTGYEAANTLTLDDDIGLSVGTVTATFDNQNVTLDFNLGAFKLWLPFIGK